MTPKEYARLMGADDYRIKVPDNQAYFGFGDAVCVPAISWIAMHCLDPLVRKSRLASMLEERHEPASSRSLL